MQIYCAIPFPIHLKRIPLQTVLVLPFVLQIFAAVGLTGWLSLQNGEAAVNDVATQLREETTARIEEKLNTYLETPHLINQINADAFDLGQLQVQNSRMLERHFWIQMKRFQSVTSIAIGTPAGEFIGVGLPGDGKVLKIGIAGRATQGNFHSYGVDAQGNRTRLERVKPNYDPRVRPWYQTAVRAKQGVWSQIYTDFADPRLAITAGQPFYDRQGRLQGVLATDLILSHIGDFLRSLKIGRSGHTFIMERSGQLVASSTTERPFLQAKNQVKRIEAVNSRIPLVRSSAQYLQQEFQDLRHINRPVQLSFYNAYQKQFLQVTPLRDSHGLDWLIVVVVPESDFMERIHANNRTTVLLCLASLAIAIWVGMLTSRWITSPILKLSDAAKAFSADQQEQIVAISRQDELGSLARTFNEMQRAIARERRLFIGGPVTVFRWLTHDSWPVEYVSPNVEQFGYQPEAFTSGQISYASIIHPEDVERVAAELLSYEKAGVTSFEQDYRIVRADGTVRWVYDFTVPVRDHQGKVICHEGYILDITERKQAEAQLQASAERDRLLAEVASRIRNSLDLNQIFNTTVVEIRQLLQVDRVYIGHMTDEDQGRVVAESVRPGCPSVLHFTPDPELLHELRGLYQNSGVQVMHDISATPISPLRAQTLAAQQTRSSISAPIMVNDRFYGLLVVQTCQQVRYWQPSEVKLIERLSTQVEIAVQQAQLFQQIQALNVGLERQVEERTAQLRQKMEELQDLYQRQDEFLHAVSHDLRTPITGTLMVLRNLQNQSDGVVSLTPTVLERMMQSCERQLNLINSLLETHYGDVRGLSLHYEAVQFGPLIQSIAADMESLLHKNQATLTYQVPAHLPPLMADPLQLRRVFENLLSNALNHNPPGLHLAIQVQKQQDNLYCTVQDDGVGMNQEQCDQLFERYTRGNRARSTGIGLGLYLCRQIITAHGGQIGVQSSPGQGATFWFTLPITTTQKVKMEYGTVSF